MTSMDNSALTNMKNYLGQKIACQHKVHSHNDWAQPHSCIASKIHIYI